MSTASRISPRPAERQRVVSIWLPWARRDDREVLSGEGQGQGTGVDFRSQTDGGISGEFPGDDPGSTGSLRV